VRIIGFSRINVSPFRFPTLIKVNVALVIINLIIDLIIDLSDPSLLL